jgi:hypothetical protein
VDGLGVHSQCADYGQGVRGGHIILCITLVGGEPLLCQYFKALRRSNIHFATLDFVSNGAIVFHFSKWITVPTYWIIWIISGL